MDWFSSSEDLHSYGLETRNAQPGTIWETLNGGCGKGHTAKDPNVQPKSFGCIHISSVLYGCSAYRDSISLVTGTWGSSPRDSYL